jgi:hypothetical protein
MATLRNLASGSYSVGNTPPVIVWTIVRGDTASFRVYVTDDLKQPLNIPDYTITIEIKRPYRPADSARGTDEAELILTLNPEQLPDDASGEFVVSLTASQSSTLRTGDIFDIELRTENDFVVWTAAQGSFVVIEDITL